MSNLSKLILMLVFISLPLIGNAMRCGNKLVSEGDYQSRIRAICGEADDIIKRTIYEVEKCCLDGRAFIKELHEPIYIEEWIYNFGPRRFMRKLSFENGELIEIDEIGYGY